jgi:hypothetical protein
MILEFMIRMIQNGDDDHFSFDNTLVLNSYSEIYELNAPQTAMLIS